MLINYSTNTVGEGWEDLLDYKVSEYESLKTYFIILILTLFIFIFWLCPQGMWDLSSQQVLNLCPWHWKADCQPLDHQGSPSIFKKQKKSSLKCKNRSESPLQNNMQET